MIQEIRDRLKTYYEEFINKWGALNKPRNRRLLLGDPYAYKILASVERAGTDGEYTGADVLYRSNKQELEQYRTEHCNDALGYCLSMYGRVDINVISDITDKEPEEVISELGDLIYYNPIKECFEEASKWLSGNVVEKMKETEVLLEKLKKEQIQVVHEEEEEEYVPWQSAGSKLGYNHPKPWRKGR